MAVGKCVFCGCEQEDHKGTYLIKNDGTINYYCSNKCRKNNLKLKRDKRKLKWTEAFRISQKKRLDSEKKTQDKVEAENKAEKHEDKKEHDKSESEKAQHKSNKK